MGLKFPVILLGDLLLEFRNREGRKQNKRNHQQNFIGFSEYLKIIAQNQEYLFQFKLESLSFQHYLMLKTIHTAEVIELNMYNQI